LAECSESAFSKAIVIIMSGNKEALIRYRAINRCICNKKTATKDELIRACTDALGIQVAWRTIAADINAMRYDEGLKYYAPIKNNRGIGYFYEDPDYSIDEIPLNQEELHALKFTSNLLKQFSSVDIFDSFNIAVSKLSERLEIGIKSNEEGAKYNFIEFETGVVQSGSEFLAQIIDAIKSKVVIKLHYGSYQREGIKEYSLHPYYLKEYRNRWYAIGWCDEVRDIRTFGLDRIKHIDEMYDTDYYQSNFNPKEYYKHALGISVMQNVEPTKIQVLISAKQTPYVLSRPIHHSQELVSQSGKGAIINLFVIINYELISTFLSLGSDLEVVSPIELKSQLMEQHRKAGRG
jgi:predicted DNA-binding transcriptional regulator YafY